MNPQIKIAIADDHPIAANGIQMMLSGQPDMEITTTYVTKKALPEGPIKKIVCQKFSGTGSNRPEAGISEINYRTRVTLPV